MSLIGEKRDVMIWIIAGILILLLGIGAFIITHLLAMYLITVFI